MRAPPVLDLILRPGSLRAAFQPIFELRGTDCRLHSFEALVRGPRGTTLEAPAVLFEYVRRRRVEDLVDRACISTVFQAVGGLPGSPDFSVNVHASTLGRDQNFPGFLEDLSATHAVKLSRVTLEILEHAGPREDHALKRTLAAVRDLGGRIALDDVGLGQSNYRMMLECRPDLLKIDRYLIEGCHRDRHRVAVLESISLLAPRLGARVVAEGVEHIVDLETVTTVGIDLIQGFLLSPPLAASELARSGDFGLRKGAEAAPLH